MQIRLHPVLASMPMQQYGCIVAMAIAYNITLHYNIITIVVAEKHINKQ